MIAMEACLRSPSVWEGGGELGKVGGEKGGTSKGEKEERVASSPSWGLMSREVAQVGLLPSQEVGLLPTSSGCGLELLPFPKIVATATNLLVAKGLKRDSTHQKGQT